MSSTAIVTAPAGAGETERTVYIYRRHPVRNRAYQIFKCDAGFSQNPVMAGEYVVLEETESASVSEKKLENIVRLLNGRRSLVDLGHEANKQILYRILPPKPGEDRMPALFYYFDENGQAVHNALLSFERDHVLWG